MKYFRSKNEKYKLMILSIIVIKNEGMEPKSLNRVLKYITLDGGMSGVDLACGGLFGLKVKHPAPSFFGGVI